MANERRREATGVDAIAAARLMTRRQLVRRAGALGLVLPFSGALVAACGGGDEAGDGAAADTGAGTADFSGQTLRYMVIQPHVATGEILAAGFEELTGARVVSTAVPYDQVQAKATLDVQSGANEFDVFDTWYTTIGALSADGIIEDLTDWIDANAAEIQPEDFIPAIYDPYTLVDGRRYGLPFDGDTHVLFYNEEIFERNGVEPPTTWDEYVDVARTITENESGDGVYGVALEALNAPIIIGSSYANRLAGFGGAFLVDGEPAVDSEAAVQAAQNMVDVAPYALPTPLETAFDQALPAFLGGTVGMMEFWTDLGVFAQDPEQSKIVDKWNVVQLPVGGSNTTPVAALDAGFAMTVSAESKNKDLAREWVRYTTSRETNLELITSTGSGIDPTRESTLDSNEYKKFAPEVQAAAAASLNGAFAWPTIPESPQLMTALSDALAQLLQGNGDAASTMAAVQEEWVGILGG